MTLREYVENFVLGVIAVIILVTAIILRAFGAKETAARVITPLDDGGMYG